jgi:hypothetical protein
MLLVRMGVGLLLVMPILTVILAFAPVIEIAADIAVAVEVVAAAAY